MGGSGSGDWYRWEKRDTADAALGLDIRHCARQGMLRPGFYTVAWSCGGRPSGEIGLLVNDPGPLTDAITLVYRARRGGGSWEDVEQRIGLAWTPCTYGGHRPWLVCPACLRRMAILYSGPSGFYCRKCLGLVYQSQRESGGDRALTRAQAIRRRLGGSANMLEPFPPKPRGMHWRTYLRLRRAARAAEARYDMAFWGKMQRWGAMLGQPVAVPSAAELDTLMEALLGD